MAGERGLPFVASYHITPATALEAIEAYRAPPFTPSTVRSEPQLAVSADVVVADDESLGPGAGLALWPLGLFLPQRGRPGAIPFP